MRLFQFVNEGIQWSLEFGPDFVILTVKNLDLEMTMSSQESLLPAQNLLLSRTQDFLDNRLARTQIAPKPLETHRIGEEVDTNGNEQSDSDYIYIEFFWKILSRR